MGRLEKEGVSAVSNFLTGVRSVNAMVLKLQSFFQVELVSHRLPCVFPASVFVFPPTAVFGVFSSICRSFVFFSEERVVGIRQHARIRVHPCMKIERHPHTGLCIHTCLGMQGEHQKEAFILHKHMDTYEADLRADPFREGSCDYLVLCAAFISVLQLCCSVES